MKLVTVWRTVFVVVSFQSLSSEAVNPGFRVILTTKGLEYAHKVGLSLLKEWLCDHPFPYTSANSEVGIAQVYYNFSNVVIHSLDFGESYLTSDYRGLILNDDDASLSMSADWLIYEDDWPYFRDYGSGSVAAEGMSIRFSTDVLANKTNGHFVLNATSCSFSIDKIDIVFSNGTSFLYSMFGPAINDLLKHEMNKRTCSQVMKWINTLGNNYVESLPVFVNVTDGAEISYALVSDANFTKKGYVVTDHKGEFMLSASQEKPPFDPPPLPDPSGDIFNNSKMVYMIATTYVIETASCAYWNAKMLVYNVSSDELKPFDTTTGWCGLKLVSQKLCEKFPKKKVMLGIAASEYPKLNVTEKYAVMHAKANASMYVDNDGREELAFTLGLSVQADATPYLEFNETRKQYVICGTVNISEKINISLLQTNIGSFDCSVLDFVIKKFVLPGATDYINRYTEAGFPIPSIDGVSLHSTTLRLGNGFFVFGSDIDYKHSNMTCIYEQ